MIAFVRMTYSLQAHVRAFGRGPYRNEEKRDKRTCWRKKRLGGTFPGIRSSLCPFISATVTSPYKLILLLGVKRYPSSTTPVFLVCVALCVLSAARLSIYIATIAPNYHSF